MKSKPLLVTLILSGVGLVSAPASLNAGIITQADMEAPGARTAGSPATAHESCAALLDELAKSQAPAASMIEADQIEALRKLHDGVRDSVGALRERMDQAILVGVWRSPAARTGALELLSRLEGIRVLNKINLAFLNGYPHPTGKVSASVADATQRMFSQIAILREETRRLNAVAQAASSTSAR